MTILNGVFCPFAIPIVGKRPRPPLSFDLWSLDGRTARTALSERSEGCTTTPTGMSSRSVEGAPRRPPGLPTQRRLKLNFVTVALRLEHVSCTASGGVRIILVRFQPCFAKCIKELV